MSLSETLERDYITAYKAKQTIRLGVLRLVKTSIKNFQVQHLRPATDDDIMDIIAAQCKRHKDSIEQYTAAGRPELADKEAAEMEILNGYMPTQLTGEELTAAIEAAIEQTGASGLREMGRVMQQLLSANKGRIDGKVASDAVKAALQARA